MMKEAESKTDDTYQRLTWDALRKSINGLVNKANAVNIRPIIKELLSEVQCPLAAAFQYHEHFVVKLHPAWTTIQKRRGY